MDKKIKNGKEILDEFFDDLKENPEINKKISNILKELHEKNKFSDRKILDELLRIREETFQDEN